jgi:hypothetical protein
MAEEQAKQVTENGQTSEQGGEGTANAGGAEKKTFSQDDVNRIIKARAERELQTVLQEAGLAGVDELKGLVQAKRQADYKDARSKYKARAYALFDEIAGEIERRHADVNLNDPRLLTALQIISVSGKDDWQLHDSIIRQFHGNQQALQVLKAAYDKAGIPTGIEKHIYDYEDKLRQAQTALERAFTGVEKHTFYGAAKLMQEIARYEGYDLDVEGLFPTGKVDEIAKLMGLSRNWDDE